MPMISPLLETNQTIGFGALANDISTMVCPSNKCGARRLRSPVIYPEAFWLYANSRRCPPRAAAKIRLLLTMIGCTLFEPIYDWGRTLTLVGVIASVLTEVTAHSADDVSRSKLPRGTTCRIRLASRAATRKDTLSSSRVGNEYDMFDSVPERVIHKFCGLLFVPAKTRRCSK